jgi:hypothetical protein
MGIEEAEAAMLELESTQCSFDYEKADYYRSKVRCYVERKHALFPGKPDLFDVSSGRTKLPTSLEVRVEKWMAAHPEYSPFMKYFAKYYLISLLDDDCDGTLYVPLAECVVEGADFYLETCMFYLRDAGGVSTYDQKANGGRNG